MSTAIPPRSFTVSTGIHVVDLILFSLHAHGAEVVDQLLPPNPQQLRASRYDPLTHRAPDERRRDRLGTRQESRRLSCVSRPLGMTSTEFTLGAHENCFETPFLEAIEKYCELKSEVVLAKDGISDYLKTTEEWLGGEEGHVEKYFNEARRVYLTTITMRISGECMGPSRGIPMTSNR